MAVAHSSSRLAPLTILLTPAERRRVEAAAKCVGATAERFTRNLLLAAVRSIEDSERARPRRP